MRRTTGALGGHVLFLGALGLSGCALVFDYGDYGDTSGPTSPTGTAGEGGTGAAGGTSGGGGTTGGGGSIGGGGTTSTGEGGAGAAGGAGGSGGCAPGVEVPLNDVDEDCDGVAGGQHVWHARFGDAEEQALSHVAVDGSGNVLLTGHYHGTLGIGSGNEVGPPATGPDMFLAKLDPQGGPVWIRNGMGAATPRESHGVAADGDGNAFVTGHFVDTAQGPDPRAFVRQVLADGGEGWTEELAGASVSAGAAVATDTAGLVYVAGHYRGTIDFADAPRTSAGDGTKDDVFVARYDAVGALMWSQSFGGDEGDAAWAVAANAAGESFVTGEYRGTPPGLPDAGNGMLAMFSAIFAMKLSPSGAVAWKKGFPSVTLTTGNARGKSVAVDKEGAVWITGAMYGDTKFGSGDALLYSGGADLFVAKLDSMFGEVLWARSFGDGADQVGTSVAVAEDGAVFVAGAFSGTMDLDPTGPGGELTAQSGQDLFLVKLDAGGHHLWSARLAQAEPPGPRDLGLATYGDHLVLAGGWLGGLDFGSGGVSPPLGGLDVFAVKLSL
jgi:hypothetical protein